MSVDQWFTILITMALTNRSLYIEHMPTMVENLHWADKATLGLTAITTNQVEYLGARIARACALPEGLPDNKPGKSTDLSPILSSVLNDLVGASDPVRAAYERGAAVDGTRVASRYQYSWDLDPATGKRVKRFSDPDATFHAMSEKDDDGRVVDYHALFGYCITPIVNAPLEPGNPDHLPMTAMAVSVSDAVMGYTNEHLVAGPLIEHIAQRDMRVQTLTGDNGYYYHQNFPGMVRAAGIEPVMPLHSNRRGTNGSYQGAVVTADVLVCPATAENLLDITGLSGESLTQTVDKRRPYELDRHGSRRPDGSGRFSCPAERGKVRCPKKPKSMRKPTDRPTIIKPPEHDYDVCRQRTITVPGDVANYEQKYPVGTTQNAAQFGIHQRVESFFAQLKSRRTGGLEGHGVAVKGIVKNAILYVAAIAAQNVKLFIGTLTRTKTAVCDAAEALAWLDQQSPVWLGVTEAFASRGQDP